MSAAPADCLCCVGLRRFHLLNTFMSVYGALTLPRVADGLHRLLHLLQGNPVLVQRLQHQQHRGGRVSVTRPRPRRAGREQNSGSRSGRQEQCFNCSFSLFLWSFGRRTIQPQYGILLGSYFSGKVPLKLIQVLQAFYRVRASHVAYKVLERGAGTQAIFGQGSPPTRLDLSSSPSTLPPDLWPVQLARIFNLTVRTPHQKVIDELVFIPIIVLSYERPFWKILQRSLPSSFVC